MKEIKNMNGITLIALIITIIVLLILAGVVINMTIGNNGIIEKSQVATEKYKENQALEELRLKVAEINIEKKGKATLQDIVDGLNADNQNEYVVSLTKIATINGEIPTVNNAEEIYVAYKNYQFRIDSKLNVTFAGKATIVKKGEISSITAKLKTATSVEVTITTKNADGARYSYELFDGENKVGETINSNRTTQEFTELTAGKDYTIKVNLIKDEKTVDTKQNTIGIPKLESITIEQDGATGIHAVVTAKGLDEGVFTYKIYEDGTELEAKRLTDVEGIEKDFTEAVKGKKYIVKVSAKLGNIAIGNEIESNELTIVKFNVLDYETKNNYIENISRDITSSGCIDDNRTPDKVFDSKVDHDYGGCWHSSWDNEDKWISIKLKNSYKVASFTIQHTDWNADIRGFKLQGSNNGTTWVDIGSYSLGDSWSGVRNLDVDYSYENGGFIWYKIFVTTPHDGYCTIGELTFTFDN